MKTLAILYICTGPYAVFWHDFYPNFKANFLPDCDRTFYVFTDAAHIDYEDAPDVRRIYQKALPWPQSTMLRFDAFLGQADALQGYDYLFFANANLHCTRVIRADELLPDPAAGQSLTAVCHLPYYGKNPIFHPYDRSGKSRASIPYSCGQYYVAGGLNGGTAAAYLALCRELTKLHEETVRTTLGEAAAYYQENTPKGEYVLVVAGSPPRETAAVTLEEGTEQVLRLVAQGIRLKDAAREVSAHTGLSKNELYAAALERS